MSSPVAFPSHDGTIGQSHAPGGPGSGDSIAGRFRSLENTRLRSQGLESDLQSPSAGPRKLRRRRRRPYHRHRHHPAKIPARRLPRTARRRRLGEKPRYGHPAARARRSPGIRQNQESLRLRLRLQYGRTRLLPETGISGDRPHAQLSDSRQRRDSPQKNSRTSQTKRSITKPDSYWLMVIRTAMRDMLTSSTLLTP